MKIKETRATECFISQAGYYTILQGVDGDAEAVLLSPEQLKLVVADMEAAIECAEDWWKVEYQEGAVHDE